ncbi:heparan-alpha-glucosaminide N-acetyltransferase domain-containing protein [Rothia nasimurium]|uniref:heparan-alpha-glucosaminide N-acetyltransferase domain-containing protein n=1 Tax=Rothia nasimurium TaxID=85336 RepID=UPI00362013C9
MPGLDLARALAIIGMVAVHTTTVSTQVSLTDPATWSGLANGRPSLLFALLGGISIALMTGRKQLPQAAELPRIRLNLTARALTIFAIGVLLEQLATNVAVILTLYGAIYFLLFPFLRLPPKILFGLSLGIALLGPLLVEILNKFFPVSIGMGHALLFQTSYSLPAWLATMLFGLGIGRSITDWRNIKVALTFLALGLALTSLGYGLGSLYQGGGQSQAEKSSLAEDFSGKSPEFYEQLSQAEGWETEKDKSQLPLSDPSQETESATDNEIISAWPDTLATALSTDWGALAMEALLTSRPHSGASAEIIGSGGISLIVLGLCLLLSRLLPYLLYPLLALGTMPLTAYSAHVFIIWLVTGPGGNLSSLPFFLFLTTVLILASSLWLLFYRRGPLEALTQKVAKAMLGPLARTKN